MTFSETATGVTMAELAGQSETNVLRLLVWHARDIARDRATQAPELYQIEMQTLGFYFAALDRGGMLALASAAVQTGFSTRDMPEEEARRVIETWLKDTTSEERLVTWLEASRR